jgi:DNA-directed RNA polymerase specialized sigma24 family protein
VAVAPSEAAFGDFVASTSASLLRAAWLLTGDQGLAEDLVQAAFERTWARWDRVGAAEQPVAYVRAVMTSIFLTWRRRRWWAEIPSASPRPDAPEVDDGEGALVRSAVLAGGARPVVTAAACRRRIAVFRRLVRGADRGRAGRLLGRVCEGARVRALKEFHGAPELVGLWHPEAIDDPR